MIARPPAQTDATREAIQDAPCATIWSMFGALPSVFKNWPIRVSKKLLPNACNCVT